MGALTEMLKRPRPVIWLDSHDYCARLLAGGNAPWLDATGFVAWQRKVMGLLKPDVATLPVAAATQAWLDAHPELRASMAAKTRAIFPLKTLLADEALRAQLMELARGLRAGVSQPVALVIPSPRAWVAIACQQAHGKTVEVGEDEADSASVFIADFLRAFGELGIDALLLEEAADFAPASAADFGCYQSVLNVAAHYRWDVGLHLRAADRFSGKLDGFTFSIAPRPLNGITSGVAAVDAFWKGGPAPQATLRFARIPADARPETVLQRLATLR